MKKGLFEFGGFVCGFSCFFLGSCSSSANVTASPSAREITYQTFYDELSPYGNMD